MADALDVAVNLLWLAPGRVGGSEQYLTRQLAGLPADAAIAPRLFCQRGFVDAHPDLAGRHPTQVLPFDRDWRGVRIVAEHTWLAAKVRRADVVHHGGGTAPLIGGRPIVLTVHDLQYLEHPQYFSPARLAYLRATVPRSVRRAAVVATPSEFTRQAVVDAFSVQPDRVLVVPHGVPEPPHLDADSVAAVRRRFGLGARPFVVYPAITHPHKGHLVLLEMLRRVDPEIALVLTGGEGAAEPDVTAAVAASGLDTRVVRTGRVTDIERDALLVAAEALVFPSEYEGFGAPLVEAMALGTPIVCSDQPAIREVVGDAAVIVATDIGITTDTSVGEAWASAVAEAGTRRAELVAAGHRRRGDFTLDASGRALAAAYQRAADA